MTVQSGAAPAVRVVGEDKDAKIIVGKRAITFGGEGIVLGRE